MCISRHVPGTTTTSIVPNDIGKRNLSKSVDLESNTTSSSIQHTRKSDNTIPMGRGMKRRITDDSNELFMTPRPTVKNSIACPLRSSPCPRLLLLQKNKCKINMDPYEAASQKDLKNKYKKMKYHQFGMSLESFFDEEVKIMKSPKEEKKKNAREKEADTMSSLTRVPNCLLLPIL